MIKFSKAAENFFEKNFYWCMFLGFVLMFPGGFFRLQSNLILKVYGNILFAVAATFMLIGFCFYVKSYFKK